MPEQQDGFDYDYEEMTTDQFMDFLEANPDFEERLGQTPDGADYLAMRRLAARALAMIRYTREDRRNRTRAAFANIENPVRWSDMMEIFGLTNEDDWETARLRGMSGEIIEEAFKHTRTKLRDIPVDWWTDEVIVAAARHHKLRIDMLIRHFKLAGVVIDIVSVAPEYLRTIPPEYRTSGVCKAALLANPYDYLNTIRYMNDAIRTKMLKSRDILMAINLNPYKLNLLQERYEVPEEAILYVIENYPRFIINGIPSKALTWRMAYAAINADPALLGSIPQELALAQDSAIIRHAVSKSPAALAIAADLGYTLSDEPIWWDLVRTSDKTDLVIRQMLTVYGATGAEYLMEHGPYSITLKTAKRIVLLIPTAFETLSPQFQSDGSVQLSAIYAMDRVSLPKLLELDISEKIALDLALKILERAPESFKDFPPRIKNNPTVMRKAVEVDGRNLYAMDPADRTLALRDIAEGKTGIKDGKRLVI